MSWMISFVWCEPGYFLFVSYLLLALDFFFFFSSRRRHTRWTGDWSSDVCSSDLAVRPGNRLDCVHVDWRPRASRHDRFRDDIHRCRGSCEGSIRHRDVHGAVDRHKIGRASCRGRGEKSGGGGTLKKKKKLRERQV